MCAMNMSNPSRQTKINNWLRRISRASAYALFAGIVVLVFSGWGITQTGVIYQISFGLIDRRLADSIHRAVNAPVTFFFLLHVLLNMRMNLTNKHPRKTWLIDGILIIVGVCMLGIVVYMEYFRSGG
jgi:hypothetical protein